MKKLIVCMLLLLSLIAILGCNKSQETKTSGEAIGNIQSATCAKAQEAGTCNSRLVELGFNPADCCAKYQKCC